MTDARRIAALAPPKPGEHTRGQPDGRPVVFYGDFDCTFCARTAHVIAPAVEDGRIRLTFRHFPVTSAHGRAEAAHRAAEAAAAQGAFWQFYDAMYGNGGRLEDPDLWRYAQAAALDLDQFDRTRRDPAVWESIRDQFKAAVKAGVSGVPVIGLTERGRLRLVAGPRTSDELTAILSQPA